MPNPTPTPTTPPDRIASFLAALTRALVALTGWSRVPHMLLVQIIERLRVIKQRTADLVAQVQAGTFVQRRYPATRKSPTVGKPREPSKLPKKFGWLVPLLPDCNSYRAALITLLSQPETAALFADGPIALRRPLRSLCWMLRVEPPDFLSLPTKPRPSRAKIRPAPQPPAPKPEPPAWMPKHKPWSMARMRGSPRRA